MTATKPLPPHGTYARANGRFYADIPPCACDPCRDAEFRYDKQRRIDKEAGRERTIPADEVAADVERLAAVGMTYRDIAAAARCSKTTVHSLRRPGARVTATVAERIATVRAECSAAKPVSAIGATRRIRAALAVGHTATAFAAQAELGLPYISELANGRLTTIRTDTHNRIDTAYRALLAEPVPIGKGPSRARNRARTKGWFRPEEWDGLIDDPDADPAAWARNDNGRIPAEDLVADAEEIRRISGVGWDLVAERLGVRRNTLEKARERLQARAKAGAA